MWWGGRRHRAVEPLETECIAPGLSASAKCTPQLSQLTFSRRVKGSGFLGMKDDEGWDFVPCGVPTVTGCCDVSSAV